MKRKHQPATSSARSPSPARRRVSPPENETGVESNRDSLIEIFCGITSVARDDALFFLESHEFSLDAAVQAFFDADDVSGVLAAAVNPERRQPEVSDGVGYGVGGEYGDDEGQEGDDEVDDDDEDYMPPEEEHEEVRVPAQVRVSARSGKAAVNSDSEPKKITRASVGNMPGIRTIADLNGSTNDSDSDSDSDDQDYYTGGKRSGMLVRDSSRNNHNPDAIFAQARSIAALGAPVIHQRPSTSKSFTGTARRLSDETSPSDATPTHQRIENVVHNVFLWRNGFSVNNGPLRRFDDAKNAEFLESIKKGRCPRELANGNGLANIDLCRMQVDYPEPAKVRSAFRGVGRTLGASSSDSQHDAPAPAPASISVPLPPPPPPSAGHTVDSSLPSTSIQVRLADGTRLVAHFNTRNTVADIRAFINASRSGESQTYQLQSGFPPKELKDSTKTIEEAGISNSVLIQKLCD